MDLYSTARRMAAPIVCTDAHLHSDDPLPIGAHGIIGDGNTTALVRADGVIDWSCMPRFDSPSVFGALLDSKTGGLTMVAPSRRPFESRQRYDTETNVLETLFHVPDQGVLRIVDFMPWTDDARASTHEIHRRIGCHEGAVEVEIVFDPRFAYGQPPTHLDIGSHGVMAEGPDGERLAAVVGNSAVWKPRPEGGVHCHMHLRAGQRCWMVLSWAAKNPEPIAAYRSFEHLRATRHAWREWGRQLNYHGPWRHHVLRSAMLLKLLIYAPSGAVVAAPTTSLPEWRGGTRNWDYRYAWIRDAALAIRAANLIGYSREARDFFHFVRDTLDRAASLRIMYTLDGNDVPREEVLDGWRGYANSAPVRIGNGARDQVQHDTAGALFDAALMFERGGGSLTLRVWRHLRDLAQEVCTRWRQPDHGIWEPRNGARHNVHSKVMSWVALNRALRIAPLFGGSPHQAAWQANADELRAEVLQRGTDPTGTHFVNAYGECQADASLLQLPLVGFIDADDPRCLATIDFVWQQLGNGSYLYRYRAGDGVGGEEGAFVLCGFWLAEVLAMAGHVDEAQEVFLAHAEASNHVGLLAEEIDPRSGEPLGNFPQAFSHLGLITAAARIDTALRMRDEGTGKLPHMMLHA